MATIEVQLAGERKRYAPGDEIRGAVLVSAAEPCRCDRVVVRLWWAAWGAQDDTDQIEVAAEARFCEQGELSGERRFPFRLRVPLDVPTTFGSSDDVVWTTASVTARIRWPGEAADTTDRVDLVIEPRALPGGPDALPPLASLRTGRAVRDWARRLGPAGRALTARLASRGVWAALDGLLGLWYRFWMLVIFLGGAFVLFAILQAAAVADSIAGLVFGGGFVVLVLVGAFSESGESVRRWLRRLDPRTLRLRVTDAPRAAGVGETLAFECAFRRRPGRSVSALRWSVRVRLGAGSRVVRHGPRGAKTTVTVWKYEFYEAQSGTIALPDTPRGRLRFECVLPPRVPATLTLVHRRMEWQVRVAAEERGHLVEDRRAFVVAPYHPPTEQPEPAGAESALVAAPDEARTDLGSNGGAPVSLPVGDRRRAAYAVARLRTTRGMQVRAALDPLLVFLLAALPLGPIALVTLVDFPFRVPACVELLAWMAGGIGVLDLALVLPVLGLKALRPLAKNVLALPFGIVRWASERRAEALLLRDGVIPRDWFDRRFVRTRAVHRLLDLEPELVLDGHGVRAVGGGVPDDCPTCGAPLDQPGPGLRRCVHCAHERYEPLSAHPDALDAAARAVRVARTGDAPPPGDMRARARALCDERIPWLRRALRWGAGGVAFVFVGTAILDALGFPAHVSDGVEVFVTVTGIAAAAAASVTLAIATFRWVKLYVLELRPDLRAYEALLTAEVLRAVAHQGQLPLDALAAHLDVSRRHLDALVAHLSRHGRAPFYHDRESDSLVSVLAATPVDSRCPSCGGHAEPSHAGTLTCTHCGGVTRAA